MLTIDRMNNITLTQGNSAEIDITPIDTTGEPVQLESGDMVVFTIKHCRKEVFRKVLGAEDWDVDEKALKLILNPEDTEDLPPCNYEYDCMYIFEDGSAYTFIDKATFKIVRAISEAPKPLTALAEQRANEWGLNNDADNEFSDF